MKAGSASVLLSEFVTEFITSPAGGCSRGGCISWGIAVPGTTFFCMFDKSLFLESLACQKYRLLRCEVLHKVRLKG